MHGIVFEPISGGTACFIDDRFPELNKNNAIANTKTSYTRLVFFKETCLYDCIGHIADFPGKVDICLIGCASKTLLNTLTDMQQQGIIRQIILSLLDVYGSLDYDGLLIGTERWDYFGTPDGLAFLDLSIQKISDVKRLLSAIDSIVESILLFNPCNDLEKIIAVDLWFQKNVQYIQGKESFAIDGVYICDTIDRDSRAEDVILHRFGACGDIAFTAAMVLNHPKINVPCRQVSSVRQDGFNHSWNIVTCRHSDYYIDFTHNITRNPNRVPQALKAKSYSFKFTLLGLNDAEFKYGTTTAYSHDNISPDSFNRNHIQQLLHSYASRGISLSWDESVVKTTRFIPKEQEL